MYVEEKTSTVFRPNEVPRPNMVAKTYGFAPGGVWVMGYRSCMGYGMHFPANQLGGLKRYAVSGYQGYGLRGSRL